MRTSLFLSTLCAVSLLGGAALAEKTGASSATPREPRAVERFRAHGDTVDKSYRTADAAAPRSSAAGPSAPSRQAAAPSSRAPVSKGADRVNCSDTGVDCLAAKGTAPSRPAAGGERSNRGGRDARPPAFLDKILGSDRTNFNEAGEDQGMSVRAANRAWSRAAGSQHGSAPAARTLGSERQADRKTGQAGDARMSSGEDDVGYMSPKAARKEWAKASIAAGTWTGPAKEPVQPADVRIMEYRAHEGAGEHSTAGKEGRARESGGGSGADHQH
jgi:hypothetical protein